MILGKSGIIYQRKQGKNSFLNNTIRALGYTAMIMSVATVVLMGWPIAAVEVAYRLNRLASRTTTQAFEEPRQTFADVAKELSAEPEQEIVSQDTTFGLVIPKIAVNTTVIPNIDVAKEDEYLPALKQGVAHAKGTYLPGQGGTIYIFGHSTDYVWNMATLNAQFYLLKELVVGDEIVLYYSNRKFVYRVVSTQVADASDVSFLEPKKTGERLILQTCWPPGTAWNRYIVEAIPVLDK